MIDAIKLNDAYKQYLEPGLISKINIYSKSTKSTLQKKHTKYKQV